jgi:hypothetical protein
MNKNQVGSASVFSCRRAHTHTHAHTPARRRWCTRTPARVRARTRVHVHARVHTRMPVRGASTRTHARAHGHARARSCAFGRARRRLCKIGTVTKKLIKNNNFDHAFKTAIENTYTTNAVVNGYIAIGYASMRSSDPHGPWDLTALAQDWHPHASHASGKAGSDVLFCALCSSYAQQRKTPALKAADARHPCSPRTARQRR